MKQEVTEERAVMRLTGGLFTGAMVLACLLVAVLIYIAPRFQLSRFALLLSLPIFFLNLHIGLMYSVRKSNGLAASVGWLIAACLGVYLAWFLAILPFAYGYGLSFMGAGSVPVEFAKEELLFQRTLALPFQSYLAFPQLDGQLRAIPGLDLWMLLAFLALSGGAVFFLMKYGARVITAFAALLSAALLSVGASAFVPGLADLVPQARGIPLYPHVTLTDIDRYWLDEWRKVSFVATGPPDEIRSYYKETLPAHGWSFSTAFSHPAYLVFYSEESEGEVPWNREVIVESLDVTGAIVIQRVPNVRRFPAYGAGS